ncbi:MAG: tetratricopeptide repeat protein [Candidatus Thorarchaeota archaeon]
MGKDPELTAQKQLIKADQLFKARLFKKAGKTYHSVGNTYLKTHQYQIAKKCFLNAMASFLELERYETAIELLRQASEASLRDNQYLEAFQLYKDAMNYIPKLKSEGEKNQYYILFSVLSYFCLHVTGSPEDGLDYIKRNRNKIDNEAFKENDLIQLVSELTISIRERTEKYLETIKKKVTQFKLRDPELELLKIVLLLIETRLILQTSLKLDKEDYTTNDLINLTLELNTNPLFQLVNDLFYNFKLNSLQITKFLVNLSDNLTTNKKPDLPILVNSGTPTSLLFAFKPHFQLDNPKIGPITLTMELNTLFSFNFDTEAIIPRLTSPLPTLLVSIKNLRPPLLDQTFPLEILVENRSQGEALDVNLQVQFPEELKIMRGTTEKQIYSLRTNEILQWEVNLKPSEVGDYIIKIYIKFKDSDANVIEEVKEFPFSIKM